MGDRRRLIRGAFLAIGLSAAGLAALVYATGGRQLLPTLARLDPRPIGLVIGLMVLYWACDAGRMMALASALGGDLRGLNSLRVSLVGAAAANLTPFNSGGEALQAYLLSRCGLTVGEATAIVAVKTFLNAVARLALGLAIPAWLISIGEWHFSRGVDVALRIGLSLYACGLAVAVYLILRPEAINAVVAPLLRSRIALRTLGEKRSGRFLAFVRRTIDEFRDGLVAFRRCGRSALLASAGLSFAAWLILISIPAFVLRAFGLAIPFVRTLGAAIVFYFAAAYAPTPGSSGVAEIGFAALFSAVVPVPLLGPFVAVWRLLTYHLTIAAGGLLMASGAIRGQL